MASPFARCARLTCGVAVFASFLACGGASDPGLFSASSSAGNSNRAGASSDAGASARGGSTAQAGASNAGDSSLAGESSTEGGAENGGSSAAGSSSSAAGSSGAAQAGATNAGASAGGSVNGGAANGGSAGSMANAGSGGGDEDTCQTLFAKASKQLAAAQVCNLAVDAIQCTGTVKNLCKCEVPVNREASAEAKAYETTLEQLDKKKCVQLCSALACFPATHSVCKASALGSAAGTCVASYAQPL